MQCLGRIKGQMQRTCKGSGRAPQKDSQGNSTQIFSTAALNQQATLGLWSSYLVKPDDMWMAKHLHYLNFPENLLQVFVIQLGLIYDFNGNLATEEENAWVCY